MAMTNFGTNDPLAVNLWSKSIDVEALKHTDIFPLTGDGANSVIHRNADPLVLLPWRKWADMVQRVQL